MVDETTKLTVADQVLGTTNTWQSTHWYPSVDDSGEESCTHVVRANRRGNRWVLESVSDDTKSHMTINLTVDGPLATGTWSEDTLIDGVYEGMTYSGAMQLLVSPDGQRMEGQWVGVGRAPNADGSYEPHIYTGRWLLEK